MIDSPVTRSPAETIQRTLARVVDWSGHLPRGDTRLSALGLDSLGRLCLVDACRVDGVVLDDSCVSAADTVADLIACVRPEQSPESP